MQPANKHGQTTWRELGYFAVLTKIDSGADCGGVCANLPCTALFIFCFNFFMFIRQAHCFCKNFDQVGGPESTKTFDFKLQAKQRADTRHFLKRWCLHGLYDNSATHTGMFPSAGHGSRIMGLWCQQEKPTGCQIQTLKLSLIFCLTYQLAVTTL